MKLKLVKKPRYSAVVEFDSYPPANLDSSESIHYTERRKTQREGKEMTMLAGWGGGGGGGEPNAQKKTLLS
jgi:hypothetical protein